MTRYYDELATYERDGFTVIVDKSYEDLDPKDCFDDECFNMKEMYADIESGRLDWFMLRVRVFVDEVEMTSEYLGGCLYADAKEILTDGTAEDIISTAIENAKKDVYRLYKRFQDLSWQLDAGHVA